MSRVASSHLQKGLADQTFGYYLPVTVIGLLGDIDSPFIPCLLFLAGITAELRTQTAIAKGLLLPFLLLGFSQLLKNMHSTAPLTSYRAVTTLNNPNY